MAGGVPRRQPKGLVAVAVTMISAMVGAGYYAYLVGHPFPPDVARLVPAFWLLGVAIGFALAVDAIRASSGRHLGIVGLILNIPNAWFAAMFALAALLGD